MLHRAAGCLADRRDDREPFGSRTVLSPVRPDDRCHRNCRCGGGHRTVSGRDAGIRIADEDSQALSVPAVRRDLPIAAAISAVGLSIVGTAGQRVRIQDRAPVACWSLSGLQAVALLLSIDRNGAQSRHIGRLAGACRWIQHPADSVVFTPPRESWAFKWYAERAEFVSFKDCPQDAEGIVQWNRRLLWIQDWAQRTYGDGLYTAADLRELYNMHGITHVLAGRLGPMEMEPAYQNGTFRVYSLVEDNDK
jgi:hypothetical protein